MTLKKKSEEYVASIRSEKYAVGRTLAQKTIDGIVAGNAFAAGYRAALKDVEYWLMGSVGAGDAVRDIVPIFKKHIAELGEK